jgi:hypothetical protein
MTKKGPGAIARLIRPNGEVTLTLEFTNEVEAEERYGRLIEACSKDRWIGARVQCLDNNGNIIHEHVIKV